MTEGKRKFKFHILLILTLITIMISLLLAGRAHAQDATGTLPDRNEEIQAQNASGILNGKIRVDPVDGQDGYSTVLYDNMNGLPTSEANAIAMTSEGFIWIGSYSGLIRYDGQDFERADSSTGIASVKELYVDRDDRLWVGSNDNGVYLMDKNDEIRNWNERDGMKSTSVRSIVQDENGEIYVGTTNGIYVFDSELNMRQLEDSKLEETFVQELRIGADGILYELDNAGVVFAIKKDRPVRSLWSKDERIGKITAIYPDPVTPGYLYLASGDSTVYYCSCDGSLKVLNTFDVSPLSQVQQLEFIDGALWLCARNGIGVVDKKGFHALDNVPMDNSIGHVMTDYAGNLWFTSSRQGVMKIVPNRFTNIFERYHLPETVVNSTCMCDGQLFIGSDSGLIVLKGEEVVDSLPLTRAVTAGGTDLQTTDLLEFLNGDRIRCIKRDSRGRLWICTWRCHGLLLYDKGSLTAFTTEDGLFSEQIRTTYEMKDGTVLVANTGGVNVIKDGRVTAAYGEEDGITNSEILSLAEGKNGDILVGTDGGGIFILGKEGVRHIGRTEGMTSEAVMRIKPDLEGNFYWVITGTSIAVLSDDYQLRTLNRFPYTNNFDLYENGKGEVWVLSSSGVYICNKKEMVENEIMEPLHFGRSDGLPCTTTANSYSELTEQGDLYIAGTTCIAKVNIQESFEDVSELKASVPYIEANGTIIYPDSEGKFTIPHNVKKLTVYSYVFNYSLINPNVSYYLEGFDEKETTVDRSDLAPVDYTNLPGGSYRFVMRLEDSLGRKKKEISVSIFKEKSFRETPLFFLLAFLLLAAVITFVVNLYIREKMAVLERRHREKVEKERLISELKVSSELQASVLPHIFPPFPDRKEFDLYASMNPAKEVGGDLYDFFMVDDDHLCMIIADVSGKGIPAALFMMISKAILKNSAVLIKKPGEILTIANDHICSSNQMEMFITVWVGILEISTGIIKAANAGHEYPALMKDGIFSLLKDKHGLVLGAMEGSKYREYEIRLEPGDKLFVYTDGVPEATDADNKLFGTDRMLEALNSEPDAGPHEILLNVHREVNRFVKDAEQFDDLTMLCMEYKGPIVDSCSPSIA